MEVLFHPGNLRRLFTAKYNLSWVNPAYKYPQPQSINTTVSISETQYFLKVHPALFFFFNSLQLTKKKKKIHKRML